MLRISLSVVEACSFLEERKVVHRNLMCRNVLVGTDHRTIKLCGFDAIRETLRQDEYVQESASDPPLSPVSSINIV